MIDVINPATKKSSPNSLGTAEDVNQVVARAKAVLAGTWRGTTGGERAAFLRALSGAWKVAPATVVGCTMVLKPSEFTSLAALELALIAGEV